MTNKPKFISNDLDQVPETWELYQKELNNPEIHSQIVGAFDKRENSVSSLSSITNLLKEKGKDFVSLEKEKEWNKYIENNMWNLYGELHFRHLFVVMDSLEKGKTFDEVKKILDKQNHSWGSEWMLLNAVLMFSKRWEEFYKFCNSKKI